MLLDNKIYNCDCLEAMKEIDDKSIDLIVCDLPYGCLNKKNPNAQWDKPLPLNELWEQYERIIKDDGAIVLFGQGMFTAKLMLSNEKLWRYNLVWKKGGRVSGFLNAKKQPLRNHEDILVFYKKQPTYNPQMTIGKPLHGRGSGVHNLKNSNYGDFKEPEDTRKGETLKYPKSVLNFERPHPAKHPTEKPVELLRWIIKTYSNEGDVVLDNCMGYGSTIIAAIEENRRYIGIEIDPDFYTKSKNRIEEFKREKFNSQIPGSVLSHKMYYDIGCHLKH